MSFAFVQKQINKFDAHESLFLNLKERESPTKLLKKTLSPRKMKQASSLKLNKNKWIYK